MKLSKANSRDKKRQKAQYGHFTGSRSVFDIFRIQRERAEAIRRKKERGFLEGLCTFLNSSRDDDYYDEV